MSHDPSTGRESVATALAAAAPADARAGGVGGDGGDGGIGLDGDALSTESGGELPAALAQPPPEAAGLERQVALAKLKGKLFARAEPVTLGRYQLLELVGKGGMGVVWGAWDPKLERRVAIKVLQPTVSAMRERMLVEGQALAKLSHPNVVPIYDVGVIEDQVYLVMEWVRGENLRQYASASRSARELVAVYRQAGEGLWAAHQAGLIHRDFKPDNAIRGEDGRVRVLDFGLARGEVRSADIGAPARPGAAPRLTAGAGTPSYMAPEQASGAELTAAADQYSFCVSLREALEAARAPAPGLARWRKGGAEATTLRPSEVETAIGHAAARARAPGGLVPRHLAAAIERGTSADPAQRFGSMRELLAVLDHDPARRRRRRALMALGGAAAVAAFALGRSGAAPDPCSGGAAELAAAWGPQVRGAVTAHLDALGDYGREQAVAVVRDLEQAASSWSAAHRQACAAHQRAELTSELYQRRLGCLARTKVALGTVAELLVGARREALDNALLAARSLPDATLCAQGDAAQLAPPPAHVAGRLPAAISAIERARILALAARPEAKADAERAAALADALGYPPVVARAQLVLGQAEASLAQWPRAEAVLTRALDGAVAAGDDAVAVEAFARLSWVASRGGREVDGASIVEPLARRTGPAGAFARTLLYNNLATRQLARADRAGAQRYLEAAQAELAAQRGPVDVELLSVAQNLVLVAEAPAERERRASAVVAATERALGANHARTLAARVLEANETASLALSRSRFSEVCERYLRAQPHLAVAVANCFYRMGQLADEAGELEAARAAMRRAADDPSPQSLQAEVARLYLAAHAALAPSGAGAGYPSPGARVQDAGEWARAQAALEALVAAHRGDEEFWQRLAAVDAAVVAASTQARVGARAEATRWWQRALALAETIDPPLVQRRLARIRAELALALAVDDPPRAGELAAIALRWYRAADGESARVRALAALMDSQGGGGVGQRRP